MSLNPLPGALRLGLRRLPGEVGGTCPSQASWVHRVGIPLGRPLGVGVDYLIAFYPPVGWGPSDGGRAPSFDQKPIEPDLLRRVVEVSCAKAGVASSVTVAFCFGLGPLSNLGSISARSGMAKFSPRGSWGTCMYVGRPD